MFCARLWRSQVSIRFFKNARNAKFTSNAAGTGSMIIPVCKTTQEFEQARKLWQQMKEQGKKLDPGCYPVLMECFHKFGTLEQTLNFFNEMKETGIRPSTQICNNMITGLAKSDKLDEARKFLQDIRHMGAVHRSLYSTMIWVLCQGNRPKDAEEYLNMMVDDELGIDDICCNVIISAYEKAGCYLDCIRIFEFMRQQTDCVISPSTNSLMLEVYLKAGHFGDFDKLFKTMQQQRMFGYSGMIEKMLEFYALSTSRSRDAELLYDHMKKSSIVISMAGYNKLMEVFTNGNNPSMVERVYRELPKKVKPDETSKRWLLRAYLKAGSLNKAFKVYEEIIGDGFALDDPISCQLLLAAYVKTKRFSEAMQLAVRMRNSHIEFDEEVYRAISGS